MSPRPAGGALTLSAARPPAWAPPRRGWRAVAGGGRGWGQPGRHRGGHLLSLPLPPQIRPCYLQSCSAAAEQLGKQRAPRGEGPQQGPTGLAPGQGLVHPDRKPMACAWPSAPTPGWPGCHKLWCVLKKKIHADLLSSLSVMRVMHRGDAEVTEILFVVAAVIAGWICTARPQPQWQRFPIVGVAAVPAWFVPPGSSTAAPPHR